MGTARGDTLYRSAAKRSQEAGLRSMQENFIRIGLPRAARGRAEAFRSRPVFIETGVATSKELQCLRWSQAVPWTIGGAFGSVTQLNEHRDRSTCFGIERDDGTGSRMCSSALCREYPPLDTCYNVERGGAGDRRRSSALLPWMLQKARRSARHHYHGAVTGDNSRRQ